MKVAAIDRGNEHAQSSIPANVSWSDGFARFVADIGEKETEQSVTWIVMQKACESSPPLTDSQMIDSLGKEVARELGLQRRTE